LSRGSWLKQRLTSTNTKTNNNYSTNENNNETTNLSCYSESFPPELGSFVVVNCERVDDSGVWCSLPDWGPQETYSALLPIGSVVRQRGRGERKAQAAFLARARRLTSKGQPLLLVACVEEAEAVSSRGVDELDADGEQKCQSFHITVTRRGISDDQEAKAIEMSRQIQSCARKIIDKAAEEAGVSRLWARRVALYETYHQAVMQAQEKLENRNVSPEEAAVHTLVHVLGRLPEDDGGAVDEARRYLRLPNDAPSPEAASKKQEFLRTLVSLCRERYVSISKPVVHSISSTIGGRKNVADASRNGAASMACDVRLIKTAISSALAAIPAPEGCEPLLATTQGPGKWTFRTKASEADAETAQTFLKSVIARAKDAWATGIIDPQPDHEDQASVVNQPTVLNDKEVQPSLNIGLIGDVANGKSTLIKAITGKRTQAHSTEQRAHGMTIKLGFTNAAILWCKTCDSFCFLSEAEDSTQLPPPLCEQCNGPTEVTRRVSFIDCPGHAELMATMLTGASAFDAVIFAAAANSPCPSPQVRHHLEALKSSRIFAGKKNIAIAQTKAELITQKDDETSKLSPVERLELHATNAKEQLKDTVAAGAPFFPVCAPMKLGLQPLAKWLANLLCRRVLINSSSMLSCARADSSGQSLRVRCRGRGFPELFSKIVRRCTLTFVSCQQCRGVKTELLKEAGHATELLCRQCNARRFVSKS